MNTEPEIARVVSYFDPEEDRARTRWDLAVLATTFVVTVVVAFVFIFGTFVLINTDNASTHIDYLILFLLCVWFWMDRHNIYVHKEDS